jgi:hypothetical protein
MILHDDIEKAVEKNEDKKVEREQRFRDTQIYSTEIFVLNLSIPVK